MDCTLDLHIECNELLTTGQGDLASLAKCQAKETRPRTGALECAAAGSNIKEGLAKYSEAYPIDSIQWIVSMANAMEGPLSPQAIPWGCQIVALLKS